jgi:hypothetical protein
MRRPLRTQAASIGRRDTAQLPSYRKHASACHHPGVELYEWAVAGEKIAYFDYTAEYRRHEDWGMHLANAISARLRASLGDQILYHVRNYPPQMPPPEGPHFVYDAAPHLFLGRRGRGPLHVAWDTNLLIDYFTYGSLLWKGMSLPGSVDGDSGEELEGLQLILGLWVMRDIRFAILPDTVDDAKKQLSAERRESRVIAFEEFASALSLVEYGEPEADQPTRDGLLILPDAELERAISKVPAGYDQKLVRSAAHAGMHVFLTGDHKVLRNRDALRPFGLLLASPLDLLEALFGCGAFLCLLAPRFAYWPLPDQMRVGHLIEALPPVGRPTTD